MVYVLGNFGLWGYPSGSRRPRDLEKLPYQAIRLRQIVFRLTVVAERLGREV